MDFGFEFLFLDLEFHNAILMLDNVPELCL